MMRWEITEMTDLPELRTAAREHLRNLPDDDSDLNTLIMTAREYCENYTGKSFGEEKIRVYVDAARIIELPRTPANLIISVSADGEEIRDYTFNKPFGTIVFEEELKNIEILYSGGMKIPLIVRQAILMLIGHWDSNREGVVVGAIAAVEPPIGVKELLKQEKGWWF